MSVEYKYNAFISYRHTEPDKTIAARLQKMLESYTPPKSVAGPKFKHWHVFRDETELPTSSNLSEDIRTALVDSEFLIVICSRTTAQSKWCMEEITYFKELHKGSNSNIITLVVDGEPSEVFPYELCNELIPVTDADGNVTYQNHVIEPLAANVAAPTTKQSLKKLKSEFLRIAAPLLNCGYDNLYNRSQRQRTRRILGIGAAIAAVFTAFGVYSGAMMLRINAQNAALQAANESLNEKTRELLLANEELERKTKEAENNLIEANRQREIAEVNLEEANRQKGLAETNLTEANRQRGLAETNLAEANRQQQIATENAREAEAQRIAAEENMLVAQANEAKANEANRNLRASNAEILANQAKIYLESNDILSAISAALAALPQSEDDDLPYNFEAERVLAEATGAYSTADRMSNNTVELSGYIRDYLEFSADGTRIFTKDTNGTVYVIDYDNGRIIRSFPRYETFGSSYGTPELYTEGNTGYALYDGHIISIDLETADINWSYDTGRWEDTIISNENADTIFIVYNSYNADNCSYAVLNKDGELISSYKHGESSVIDEAYSTSSYSYYYMDANSNIYIATPGNDYIYIINPVEGTKEKLEFELPEDDRIISMGENDTCIFINQRVYSESYSFNNARLTCLNKKDFSEKWSTEYSVEGSGLYVPSQKNRNSSSSTQLDKVFEFRHVQFDDNGESYARNGIIVVSGEYIIAFDKETGEQYLEYNIDEKILFCEPNDGKGSLFLATQKTCYSQLFLFNAYPGSIYGSSGSIFYVKESITFDKTNRYVSRAGDYRLALATDNSSEIDLCHRVPVKNQVVLEEMPDDIPYTRLYADNGKGVFSVSGYRYKDDEREDYLLTYDTVSNKLLSYIRLDIEASAMVYATEDRIFICDNSGNAEILDNYGNVLKKLDLIEMFREKAGIPDGEYIYWTYYPYAYVYEDRAYICFGSGMLCIDFTNDDFISGEWIQGSIGYPYMSDDLLCFLNGSRIVYCKVGNDISFVKDGGEDARFTGDITSLTNSGYDQTIAFVNMEGYIGLYKCGDDNIRRINFSTDDFVPEKILFTPDSKYIIALCSNGYFVKYSVETLERVASYKADFKINSNTEFGFIDDNTFITKDSSYDGKAYIIDINDLSLRAEVNNFKYIMKSDKKIIYYDYSNYGYYNYLSGMDLIEFAKAYLEEL